MFTYIFDFKKASIKHQAKQKVNIFRAQTSVHFSFLALWRVHASPSPALCLFGI